MNNLFFSNASLLNEDPRNRNRFTGFTSETTGEQLPSERQIDPVAALAAYQAGVKGRKYGNQLLQTPIAQNLSHYAGTGDPQALTNIAAQNQWGGYTPADQGPLLGTYGQSVPNSVQDVTSGPSFGSPEITQFNEGMNPVWGSQNEILRPADYNFSPGGLGSTRPPQVGLDEAQFFGSNPNEISGWGGIVPSGAEGSIDASGIFSSAPGTTMGMLDDVGAGSSYIGGGADWASDSVGAMADGADDLIGSTGASTTGMGSLLSKAGSLAGLGLSAYDIANSGINAGNALGLVGSGLGTAAAFSTNPALMALGPWGWGLAGLGTVGSLMDWW